MTAESWLTKEAHMILAKLIYISPDEYPGESGITENVITMAREYPGDTAQCIRAWLKEE